METRQARREFTVFGLDLERRMIPENAILRDFRIGPGHEGLAGSNPEVASFHYEGAVYFNMAREIVHRTAIVRAAWPCLK
ncbi:MAG TPA: hypothetical protein VMU19_13700 [Bryobacteraceae bacterium]|nr:hypothetical protein [Bryobacteraceae bacterium]